MTTQDGPVPSQSRPEVLRLFDKLQGLLDAFEGAPLSELTDEELVEAIQVLAVVARQLDELDLRPVRKADRR